MLSADLSEKGNYRRTTREEMEEGWLKGKERGRGKRANWQGRVTDAEDDSNLLEIADEKIIPKMGFRQVSFYSMKRNASSIPRPARS